MIFTRVGTREVGTRREGTRAKARVQTARRGIRRFVSLAMLLGTGWLATPLLRADEIPRPTPLKEQPKEPTTWLEALTGGTVSLNLRARAEIASQERQDFTRNRLDHSEAYTERLRFGYATASYFGFSGYLEFEDIRAVHDDLYNAAGTNGQGRRTVVADPEDTEVNQAFLRYEPAGTKSTLVFGRQRITLDDHRFVGNVGWRQNEQTFDAVRADTSLLAGLKATYVYVWDVNRIFGPAANADFESDSHLINTSGEIPGVGRLTTFAYLLRFSNAKNISSNTYGARLTGQRPLNDSVDLLYEASAAHQRDGRSSALHYKTHYYRAQGTVEWTGHGGLGAGYEELGSDSGRVGFSTPIATLHGFNGWADSFLITPARGLEDLFFLARVSLPLQLKGQAIYHFFYEEHGNDVLGHEIDAAVSRKFTDNLSAQVVAAYFDGSSGFSDRVKFWLETTLQF